MSCLHLLAAIICVYIVREASLLEWSPLKLLRFIPEHMPVWRLACLAMAVASLSFVTFVVCARDVLDQRVSTLATLALVFVTIAAANDLNGLSSMLVLYSDLASQLQSSHTFMVHQTFQLSWATLDLSLAQCLLIGNTLYSFAGILIAVSGLGTSSFPKWLAWTGLPIWIATLCVSVLSFLGMLKWVLIVTMAAALVFVLWCTALGVTYLSLAGKPLVDTESGPTV